MQQQATEGMAGGGQGSGFTCPDCSGHSYTTVLHNDVFEYGDGESRETLYAKVPVHCCDSCDFEFLGREGRLIKHEAVCRHLGLLAPTEIQGIRERHGMSRTAFAEITGFGEATLNRWERGAVIQNRANDRYLRLTKSPDVLNRLRRILGVIKGPVPPETLDGPHPSPDGTPRWKRLRVSTAILQQQSDFHLAA